MQALQRRLLSLVLLLLVVAAMVAHPRPVFAQDYYCFESLEACYYRAAVKDGWVTRWLAGLDCELTLAHCIERAIVY